MPDTTALTAREHEAIATAYRNCQRIISWVHATTEAEFLANIQLQYSVERAFIIIGEAVKNIRPELLARPVASYSWREPIKMRDRISHLYDDSISKSVLWETTQESIPQLKLALEKLAEFYQVALQMDGQA